MDVIERNMRSIPGELRFSLVTLLTGSDEEIKVLLPGNLDELRRIAQVSRQSANETVEAFNVAKNILEELIAGSKARAYESGRQVELLDLQIKANKIKKDHLEKRKKELKDRKEEIKKKLLQYEKNYEEALENIPDGWDLMGMKVCEELTNAFVGVLKVLPHNVIGTIIDKVTPKEKTQDDSQTRALAFPSCNLNYTIGSGATAIVTDPKQLEDDFIETIRNLHTNLGLLKEYIKNIFKEPPKYKLSLSPAVFPQTKFLKEQLTPGKKQIENTGANSVPLGIKGPAVIFYKEIFAFMEEVLKKSENIKSSAEEIKKVYDRGQELNRNGECFKTWLNNLLQLPPITPKQPFNQNPNKEKTITQTHLESAKIKVENWKVIMQEKEEAFEKTSENLLSVSANITEKIIELASFNAESATLKEQLK